MGTLHKRGTEISYGGKTVGWYNKGEDKFEPLDNVKGDIARIYLYVYVRWQQPNLYEDVSSANLPKMDPDSSMVWTIKKQENTGRYSIYSEAAGKYVVIKSNTTSGFDLASTSTYFFDAKNAGKNGMYLTTTATGNRNISIYQTDFRSYKATNCNALYLYKLV